MLIYVFFKADTIFKVQWRLWGVVLKLCDANSEKPEKARTV